MAPVLPWPRVVAAAPAAPPTAPPTTAPRVESLSTCCPMAAPAAPPTPPPTAVFASLASAPPDAQRPRTAARIACSRIPLGFIALSLYRHVILHAKCHNYHQIVHSLCVAARNNCDLTAEKTIG